MYQSVNYLMSLNSHSVVIRLSFVVPPAFHFGGQAFNGHSVVIQLADGKFIRRRV